MKLCPILVGRSAELARLRALRSEGGVALVRGEAGLGKSRLLQEFALDSSRQGHPVIWAKPEVITDPGPYGVIADLLQGLEAVVGDPTDMHALLAAIEQPSPDREGPSARQLAARLRGFLAETHRPVLLVEDLHLADEPSQAVVAHLARSARDDHFVLIGSVRGSEAQAGGAERLLDVLVRDRLADVVDLQPLADDELAVMLDAMLDEALPKDLVDSLIRRAEGVPFFVEELASAPDGASVPDSISLAARARLQRLTASAQELVHAAALMVGAVDSGVAGAAIGLSPTAVQGPLLEAIGAGLLVEKEGLVVFRHALIKQALESSLSSIERTDLHARLARAFVEVHESDRERFALALAHHFEASGEHQEAAHYTTLAAERALRMSAGEEAGEIAARVLAREGLLPAARGRASRVLAQVSQRRGDLIGAADLYRQSAQAFDAAGYSEMKLTALLGRVDVLTARRDEEAWKTLLEARVVAEELATPTSSVQVVMAEGVAGIAFNKASHGVARLEEAATMAHQLGDDRTRAAALSQLAIYWTGRDAGKADELGSEASRLAQELHLDDLVGRLHSVRASMLAVQGNCHDAIATLDVAGEHLRGGLASHLVLNLDHIRAWVLWRMGNPAEADRFAARLELTSLAQGYGRVVRSWAALEGGDEERARDIVNQWWAELGVEYRDLTAEQARDMPESPEGGGHAMLADALLAARVRAVTRTEVARAGAYEDLCATAIPDVRAQASLLHAQACLQFGDLDGARAALKRARAALSEDEVPLRLAEAEEVEGWIATIEGDESKGRSCLAHSVELYESVQNDSDQARVLVRLADLSERDRAIDLLREAMRRGSERGADAVARVAEQRLRGLGVRPRAGRPKGSGRKRGELSAREEEVVALLASGATNAEIANRLFISDRTVQDHIRNAQKHAGVSGRAALAAWAAKQGLI